MTSLTLQASAPHYKLTPRTGTRILGMFEISAQSQLGDSLYLRRPDVYPSSLPVLPARQGRESLSTPYKLGLRAFFLDAWLSERHEVHRP